MAIIRIEVDDGDAEELRECLQVAAEHAAGRAQDSLLRSQDAATRRYAWHAVAAALRAGAAKPAGTEMVTMYLKFELTESQRDALVQELLRDRP